MSSKHQIQRLGSGTKTLGLDGLQEAVEGPLQTRRESRWDGPTRTSNKRPRGPPIDQSTGSGILSLVDAISHIQGSEAVTGGAEMRREP